MSSVKSISFQKKEIPLKKIEKVKEEKESEEEGINEKKYILKKKEEMNNTKVDSTTSMLITSICPVGDNIRNRMRDYKNINGSHSNTTLQFTHAEKLLKDSSSNNKEINKILNKIKDANEIKKREKEFRLLCICGNTDRINEFIKEESRDMKFLDEIINSVDEKNKTPLMLSVHKEHFHVTQLLIELVCY